MFITKISVIAGFPCVVCVCARVYTEMVMRKPGHAEPCARTAWRPPQGGLWSAHRKPSFILAALGKEY